MARQLQLRDEKGRALGKTRRRAAVPTPVAHVVVPAKAHAEAVTEELFPGALRARSALQGRPFASVFIWAPSEDHARRWRVKGSRVSGRPATAPTTREVLRVLAKVGIRTVDTIDASPGSGAFGWDSTCSFLDGGFTASTGEYMFGPKGAWVHGTKAVFFVALLLGLHVSTEQRLLMGLASLTEEDLLDELRRSREALSGG